MTEQKAPRNRKTASKPTKAQVEAAKKKEAEAIRKAQLLEVTDVVNGLVNELIALPENTTELLTNLKTSIDELNGLTEDTMVYEEMVASIEETRATNAKLAELEDLKETIDTLESRATVVSDDDYDECIDALTAAVIRYNELAEDAIVRETILAEIDKKRIESQKAQLDVGRGPTKMPLVQSLGMKIHVNTLNEYITTMSRGSGSSIAEQMKHQKRLYLLLVSVFKFPPDELREAVMVVVDAFKEHKDNCFSPAMVHRNFDNITMPSKNIKAYTALLRLFTVAAEKGPGNVYRYVDLPQLEEMLDAHTASVAAAIFSTE